MSLITDRRESLTNEDVKSSKGYNANGITFDNIVFLTTYRALQTGKQLIIHQGGTWSGKTYNAILAFVVYLKQLKGPPVTLSIIGPTFPQLRRGALKDFHEIKNRMPGYVTHEHASTHTYKIDNHTIEFFSISDSKDAGEKARSGKRQYCLIDECNLVDWEACDLIMGKSDIASVLTYNPYSKFWLHEMILPYWDEKNYLFKITTYKDNSHLTQKTLDWLELKQKNDPESFRVLGEGKLGQGKGLIFTDVKYVYSLPQSIDWTYGLDFGYTNDPTALVKLGEYQGELYGKEILYGDFRKKERLISKMISAGITEDDTIKCDWDFSMIDELQAAGFNVVQADKGKVVYGIERIKRYTLNIDISSTNWRKEQMMYRYQVKDGQVLNEPVKNGGHDHCWDAARYASEDVCSPTVYDPKDYETKVSVIHR
jgi:phage terminase large subunit